MGTELDTGKHTAETRWAFAVFIEDPVARSYFRPKGGGPAVATVPSGEAAARALVDRVLQDLASKHKGFDVDGGVGWTRAGPRTTHEARIFRGSTRMACQAHLFGTVEADDMAAAAKLVAVRLSAAIVAAGADDREANFYFWPGLP